ncbi:hypothetical protein [Alteromonas lipolytica]|uniref:VOC domain-containing protein n=1 Tax=Alteromonas lipolytica TaxID=1856405 RepID=A0A1E8FC32_9ALTE|nr:hypothetical protein [Alteromonas lipolytica]OFI33346.1 hypothetical protein BFC17_03535 [Alteromonas lipolytica]GGF60539.1 hypothetical protein GCM10011338_10950 [Alteromonas lipolytica]
MPHTSTRLQQHSGFTATLICPQLEPVLAAYQTVFNLEAGAISTLSSLITDAWNKPELANKRYTVLRNHAGEPWLRIIELPDATTPIPVNYFGWMALQLGINNLSAILPELVKHDFHIIGEPLFQDLGQQLEIYQCIGPAGEVLYLADNQQLCHVLSSSAYRHNNLLMPVLATSNRQHSADFYAILSSTARRYRDSRLTVVSRALNKSIDSTYPVASIPFGNSSILEINEIKALSSMPSAPQPLPSGLGMLTLNVYDLSLIANLTYQQIYRIEDDFYQGRRAVLLQGPEGEWVECIEQQM